jgi:hypothetical protein
MQGSVVLLVKTWKIEKKSFLGQSTSIAEVIITFWVMHYIGAQNFFFTMWA